MTPIASLYAAIPLCGVLIALFMVEQLVNGWRNGFEHEDVDDPLLVLGRSTPIPPASPAGDGPVESSTLMLLLFMTFCFLFFGYLGVPVAFSLLAGVLIGACSPTSRTRRSSRRCSMAWTPRRCSRFRSSCWSAS